MTNNYATMIRRIGKTTYHVKVFCKESGETMEAKILRIVCNEAFKNVKEQILENTPVLFGVDFRNVFLILSFPIRSKSTNEKNAHILQLLKALVKKCRHNNQFVLSTFYLL